MEYFYLRYKDKVLTPFFSKEKMPDENYYCSISTDGRGRVIKTPNKDGFNKDINIWKSHLIPYKWKSQEDLENVKNQVFDFENCAHDFLTDFGIDITECVGVCACQFDSSKDKEGNITHPVYKVYYKDPEETKNSKIQSDILWIMDSELSLEISEDFPKGIICNRFSCASKIAEYLKNLK